jgi:hypothetical protein
MRKANYAACVKRMMPQRDGHLARISDYIGNNAPYSADKAFDTLQ